MSTRDVPNQDWMRTGLAQSSLMTQIEIERGGGVQPFPQDGRSPELWAATHSDSHQDSHSDEHRDYNDQHGHADQHNDVHTDEHVDVFSDTANT